ncbi:hypothetical protein Taro_053671 [Colocasia esculenta]|uniref:Peroxidase n=1 Tax=Colocasia esculenta TaxID=4460 RepID=A0A843XMV4_COLES|nr:hypothetical protein [Colocasia esculenta]
MSKGVISTAGGGWLLQLLVVVLAAGLQAAVLCGAELQYGFYNTSCPLAEALVRKTVSDAFAEDGRVAAGLVRLHFHDCFVRGCDASILIDSTIHNVAEKDAVPSQTLHGYDVIDAAKAAVEAVCPGVVSCADILAFAARESAALAGNITYDVPAGRLDGTVSRAVEADLGIPSADSDLAQLIQNFTFWGLSPEDLVTLSGAHSFGVAHCPAFADRLYNFSSSSQADPTLSPAYAALLRGACPEEGSEGAVWLDLVTPEVLDNKYYAGLVLGLGLLHSDQELMAEANLRAAVEENARNRGWWAAKFAQAMVRMGSIQVQTAGEGEVRANCRLVNSSIFPRRPAASS